MGKSLLFLLIMLCMGIDIPSLSAQTAEHPASGQVQADEQSIRAELNKVKDPETGGPLPAFVPIDRVVVEKSKAVIAVRIPSYCPLKETIVKLIKDRITGFEGVTQVDVLSLPPKKFCGVKARSSSVSAVRAAPKPRLPKISRASVMPAKVYPGDAMKVSIKVNDPAGVSSVSANMGDIETVSLALMKGSRFNGTWEGVWTVHSTLQKNYVTTLKATNTRGDAAFEHVGWSDPVAWWDDAYLYRRQVTVVNNTASVLAAGHTVWATLRTSVNNMQADGDDIRVVYWNGAAHVELDRHPRYLNSSAVELYFKTQADISGNGGDSNYYIYYGNSSASNPPANGSNVYEYWEPFDNLTGWVTLYGAPSVASGIVTVPISAAIYHNMGYVGNVYNKIFEQSVKSALPSSQGMWWGEQFHIPEVGWQCGYQCCDGSYDGYRDLMVVTSVVNTLTKNSLVGLSHSGAAGDDTRSDAWDPGSVYNVYTQKWKTNEVKHLHNQTLWATHAVNVSTASHNVYMQFWNYASTSSFQVDWAAVRPYVDPEPTTTLGAQEGPESYIGGGNIGGAVIR